RIEFSKPQKEATYQITLDALKLSPCYPAFLITANALEIYMHQFWNTVNKVQDSSSYRFKLDNKKFKVDAEVFRDILQICPKLPNQPFDIPPFTDEKLMSFINEPGYTKNIETLPELVVDHMHQPWRTFAAVINRFIKIIINHFISQNKLISMRNMINLHTARDDSLLGTLKYVSKTKERQMYGALIPKEMINEDILNFIAYQTYFAYGSGAKEPMKARKFKKPVSPTLKTIPVLPKEPIKKPATKPKPTKKKGPVKADRGKGDGTYFESRVPDEQQRKISGTDEGTGTNPGVLDVPKYDFESEKESWGDIGEEYVDYQDDHEDKSDDDNDVNDDNNDDDDKNDDDEVDSYRTESSTKYDEEENVDDEEKIDEEDDDVTKDLYKDVNVNSGNKDTDMTDADQGGADQHNVSQELGFKQVKEDAHIATLAKNNPFNKPSSPILHDVEKKLLLTRWKSQEAVVLAKSTSQPKSTYKAAASLSEFELTKILMDKTEEHKSCLRADYKRVLYDAMVKSYNTEKYLFETYGEIFTLKRSRDDKDKDQDPTARSE
nr:hypothetical protein [Tanacetum cinerariifolium]